MRDQNIGFIGDAVVVVTLTISNTIPHEHRHTIEPDTINLDSGVAKIMHILIQPVDIGTIKTFIVIATYEYFLTIWQVAEPVQKVYRFRLISDHAEITGMYHHISLRQCL